ncbi:MAG: DUF2723 domain-containing protein [Candidatus Latescibacterota bacterium]
MTEGKINKIVAAGIFVIMFLIYLITVAPTLSFWDCGEFITCSYIMGTPHPPGSPLLSLIGKVMSLIPFYDFRGTGLGEIAYRVNLIDVILGAMTAMLAYLIIVRLIRKFKPSTGNGYETAIVLFSAAVTAFLIAFADEFWNNAIETETYMPSLFISMLALWLTLLWDERKKEPGALKYLFLAALIIGLGNGIHPMSLLIVPSIFLLVLFGRPDWFASVKLWVYLCLFLFVFALIKFFGSYEVFYLFVAVFGLAAPIVLYKLYQKSKELWKLTLIGIVLCSSLYVIGYSVYPTVMVRASKHPAINEGDPQTWARYKEYLNREQYGQGTMMGMISTIPARKAEFSYQFGYMYLRYLLEQFPKWGPTINLSFHNNRSADIPGDVNIVSIVPLSVLLFSLLLYGLYTHVREDVRSFLSLFAFFLATGIGLVLYLNMDNPQVRERGYFYLCSHYTIMFWIGFGIYGVITDIREWIESKKLTRILAPATVGLFIVFGTIAPAAALSNHIDPRFTNFQVHDRADDWTPWDYAYNILISCEKDAILFTNGDNDTFPLWYLQEVKGFRKDIRLVNLSLLNTDWYILQLKNEGTNISSQYTSGLSIPMKYDDQFIVNMLTGRNEQSILRRVWPVEGREVEAAGIKWKLVTPQQIQSQEGPIAILRVQDEMVKNIIDWINWTRPIYFAVTVARENMIGLDAHLSMEGMVYRVVQTTARPGEMLVNIPVLDNNVFNKYKYRGLSDPNNYIPPNTRHLVTNYFIGFAQLAERYASMGDSTNALRAAKGALTKTSNDLGKRVLLYQVLASANLNTQVKNYVKEEMAASDFPMSSFDNRLHLYALLDRVGERSRAYSFVQAEQNRMTDDFSKTEVWKTFAALLYSGGYYSGALAALDKILTIAPGDKSVIESRELLLKEFLGSSTSRDSTKYSYEKVRD